MGTQPFKRIGNLELRWTESKFHSGYYYEIVLWQDYEPDHLPEGATSKEWCYTLASWEKNCEGWDLTFVGDRPFQEDKIDRDEFWAIIKYGNKIANADFELEETIKNYKNNLYS